MSLLFTSSPLCIPHTFMWDLNNCSPQHLWGVQLHSHWAFNPWFTARQMDGYPSHCCCFHTVQKVLKKGQHAGLRENSEAGFKLCKFKISVVSKNLQYFLLLSEGGRYEEGAWKVINLWSRLQIWSAANKREKGLEDVQKWNRKQEKEPDWTLLIAVVVAAFNVLCDKS